ncbi:yjeF C-terminal region, hydroxyethylthiazole kinase-related/yjeF N-terminal region [Arboricoccus pini]|uniref:Bifunctional NAD(P)H-hydrate repair enzyme n=1 Tax=Arboricoccus pini TaxID=1963835 RepID=A0A212R0K2_9PROT|nr:NAD(P)H-hydrate dehydratase [Arboricoccus pini]SNB65337.1 yjeF C-terminal region, hydroxyethylthiazole kinase-related/yjeF N-terminal region [Arboricoccus pini]
MAPGIRLVAWAKRPLLGARQSGLLDRQAEAEGISGLELMASAGAAVARRITLHDKPAEPVLVLCGPGNNGGDGWIIATELAALGWPVRVASLIPPANLKGDAAAARARWTGPVEAITPETPKNASIIVDALFGVGLNRALDPAAASVVDGVNQLRANRPKTLVYAVDIPSGVDADTGDIRGTAIKATHTVSFVTAKPGHLLYPGRSNRGHLDVVDIGIDAQLIDRLTPRLFANSPALWGSSLPERGPDSHKYKFGHALIVGGPAKSTGASRLAAIAALRIGAGLVSVVTASSALPIYASTLTSVMTKIADSKEEIEELLNDERITVILIGPGAGITKATEDTLELILRRPGKAVLDADALSVLANASHLRALLHANVVLTPHEGEFKRLFPSIRGTRIERAESAARESGATIVLKGADTIVATPDGRSAIMGEAPPSLATAGTGDVLAGLITGIFAQNVTAFEAACAGVWLHAEGAAMHTSGLIAEDLPRSAALARGRLHVSPSRHAAVMLPIHQPCA